MVPESLWGSGLALIGQVMVHARLARSSRAEKPDRGAVSRVAFSFFPFFSASSVWPDSVRQQGRASTLPEHVTMH